MGRGAVMGETVERRSSSSPGAADVGIVLQIVCEVVGCGSGSRSSTPSGGDQGASVGVGSGDSKDESVVVRLGVTVRNVVS